MNTRTARLSNGYNADFFDSTTLHALYHMGCIIKQWKSIHITRNVCISASSYNNLCFAFTYLQYSEPDGEH